VNGFTLKSTLDELAENPPGVAGYPVSAALATERLMYAVEPNLLMKRLPFTPFWLFVIIFISLFFSVKSQFMHYSALSDMMSEYLFLHYHIGT
jgi:hypothetical protein